MLMLGDESNTLISWTQLSSPLSAFFVHPAHTTVRSPSPFRHKAHNRSLIFGFFPTPYVCSAAIPTLTLWAKDDLHWGQKPFWVGAFVGSRITVGENLVEMAFTMLCGSPHSRRVALRGVGGVWCR